MLPLPKHLTLFLAVNLLVAAPGKLLAQRGDEGSTPDSEIVGKVKSFSAATSELVLVDSEGNDWKFRVSEDTTLWSKLSPLKQGDKLKVRYLKLPFGVLTLKDVELQRDANGDDSSPLPKKDGGHRPPPTVGPPPPKKDEGRPPTIDLPRPRKDGDHRAGPKKGDRPPSKEKGPVLSPQDVPTELAAGEGDLPPLEADDQKPVLVRVFYGTDRKPRELIGPTNHRVNFYPPMLVGSLTGVFALLAVWTKRPSFKHAAQFGLATTVLLVLLAIGLSFLPGGVAMKPGDYSSDRGDLRYGLCEVTIPKDHRLGHLESPSIFHFEFKEDRLKHIVLQRIQEQPADEFFASLRDSVRQSSKQEVFVFVHGYNVSFEDAARRTAQLAYDLEFQGVPILYSWPSHGELLSYLADEAAAEWTVPHLRRFLSDVVSHSGATTVHLIAHSMGNRCLAYALGRLQREPHGIPASIKEVVFTAPDIDAGTFKDSILPAILRGGTRVTLYASSRDEALKMSNQLHQFARAGEAGDQLAIVPPMETIDASAVDTSLLGHSYYGDEVSVLSDLYYLFKERKPAGDRFGMQSKMKSGLKYWVFMPRG
jgi:esterase/lipase superfamily enzyme